MMELINAGKNKEWKILTLTAQANSTGMALSGAHYHKLPGAACFNKKKEEISTLWHKELPEAVLGSS